MFDHGYLIQTLLPNVGFAMAGFGLIKGPNQNVQADRKLHVHT